MWKLALLLILVACAAPPAEAPKRACEPLEPDERALMGEPGYDPTGCTRFERTAKLEIRFDDGIGNAPAPPANPIHAGDDKAHR